jgi:hypothetical protein
MAVADTNGHPVDEVSHLSVLVPAELRDELERMAREQERSLSAEIRVGLRRHVQAVAGPERAAR